MKKRINVILGTVFLLIFSLLLVTDTQVYAAKGETYTLNITGNLHYSAGKEMLSYINEERNAKGLSSLSLDYDLTDTAMQRAAEIACHYESQHLRPDGTAWSTISDKVWAENIAAGQNSVKEVFTAWKNSSGHYKNMMGERYTTIGIGYFEHNGQQFWVQHFGMGTNTNPETRTNTVRKSVAIDILEQNSPLLFNKGNLFQGCTLDLAKDDTYQVTVSEVNEGFDYATCIFDGTSFQWTSSDSSVATVSNDGLIKGLKTGTTTLTVTAKKGNLTPFKFTVKVGTTTVDPSYLPGKTVVKVNTFDTSGYSDIWKMLQNEVTVSYLGKALTFQKDYYFSNVTKSQGEIVHFTITYIGQYNGTDRHYSMAQASCDSIPSYEYTGSPITPSVYFSGGAVEGKDYTLSYENNINIGTATVIITGKGNYHGTLTKTFEITKPLPTGITVSSFYGTYDGKPHAITISGLSDDMKAEYALDRDGTYYKTSPTRTNAGTTTIYYRILKGDIVISESSALIVVRPIDASAYNVTLSDTQFTYNGASQKPSVTITGKDDVVLTEGTHYTLSYRSDCTSAGTHKINIQFMGNYTGTKESYFIIIPNKGPSSASAVLYGYDDVNFSWEKVEGADGYYVSYKKSTASKYSTPIKTTNTYWKKANLSDGVKYTFKVVPYVYCQENDTYYTGKGYKTASVYTLKKLNKPTVKKNKTYAKVSWNNINGESGYQVNKMTLSNGNYKLVKSYYYSAAKSSANISAAKNKTYYYKVRAYKTVDGKKIYGPWSDIRSFKRK